MYRSLFPWAIGVQAGTLEHGISAAVTGGFGGLECSADELARRIASDGLPQVLRLFQESGIRPSAFGLPVDWRGPEEKWRAGLEKLPELSAAAASLGCRRTTTWILPGSDALTLEANRSFHVERLRPVAHVLAQNGIRFGLEFISPKTLRDSFAHPFLYRMGEMLDLAAELGGNCGLLLDCWHWYTSHGTVADLKRLKPEQVVLVHVNDAPAGIDVDSQIDNSRALPAETGVIDIATFLRALDGIGYEGPVTPEPFKKELNDLPSDDARVAAVRQAMDRMFQVAGIAA